MILCYWLSSCGWHTRNNKYLIKKLVTIESPVFCYLYVNCINNRNWIKFYCPYFSEAKNTCQLFLGLFKWLFNNYMQSLQKLSTTFQEFGKSIAYLWNDDGNHYMLHASFTFIFSIFNYYIKLFEIPSQIIFFKVVK